MIREWVLQLKLGSVAFSYFSNKFGVDPRERYAEALHALRVADLASWDDQELRLSRAGILRVDTLLPLFFGEAYQPTSRG